MDRATWVAVWVGRGFCCFTVLPLVADNFTIAHCAVPENIHTPPMEGFLFCTPIPLGNSSLALYFAYKILTFKTPLPLGISNI